MADCVHMWEVAGAEQPLVRCLRCNKKWWGFNLPFTNLEAFDILRDALIKYLDTLNVDDLARAQTIWSQWTRMVPDKAFRNTLVEDHHPIIEVDRYTPNQHGHRVIYCSCGFRFSNVDDRLMGLSFSQHLMDQLSK